jgi:hypothetical protein
MEQNVTDKVNLIIDLKNDLSDIWQYHPDNPEQIDVRVKVQELQVKIKELEEQLKQEEI